MTPPLFTYDPFAWHRHLCRKCHIDLFLVICREPAFCNPFANGTSSGGYLQSALFEHKKKKTLCNLMRKVRKVRQETEPPSLPWLSGSVWPDNMHFRLMSTEITFAMGFHQFGSIASPFKLCAWLCMHNDEALTSWLLTRHLARKWESHLEVMVKIPIFYLQGLKT